MVRRTVRAVRCKGSGNRPGGPGSIGGGWEGFGLPARPQVPAIGRHMVCNQGVKFVPVARGLGTGPGRAGLVCPAVSVIGGSRMFHGLGVGYFRFWALLLR